MTNQELRKLWEFAGGVDPSLCTWHSESISVLQRKQLRAQPYTRSQLFSRMMKGQASLFNDVPVLVRSDTSDKRAALARIIRSGFPSRQKASVQISSSHCTKMSVSELVKRWERGNSIVSVTDLHFRETKFAKSLDTSALTDFNILCADPVLIENLEMMTLVISSKGNLTDTHTDDCDGSNHCFFGRKLWLCWDRMAGRAMGFEDLDRDQVENFARFDLSKFLLLPSARWLVVKENETLFLPGSLSHKVITLEDYVGVGSFYVALPSYLRALRRWILYDTLDVQPGKLLERINQSVIARIRKLEKAPARTKEKWGLSYLRPSIERWISHASNRESEQLLANPDFFSFLDAARRT